ncbi:hypothetical protein BG005_002321 [Podila minutissima]|nr:hypothetical protein BG005_002321 [Podila minutissima]
MKFQTILLVAAALMITYVQAAPIDIVEQPDVDPNDQKAKCGYDMMICLRGHKILGKSSLLGGLAVFSSSSRHSPVLLSIPLSGLWIPLPPSD